MKILDFGFARMVQPKEAAAGPNHTNPEQTEAGIVMGTAGYMSPEQVRGQVADHRSDIFAFSAILYEMLTGKRAFQKQTSVETMTAILNEDPPWISQSRRKYATGIAESRASRPGEEPGTAFSIGLRSGLCARGVVGYDAFLRYPCKRSQEKRTTSEHRHCGRIAGSRSWGLEFSPISGCGSAPAPQVANYVQLTHDGLQKSLIGTDGSRLYLTLINSGVQDVAAIEISGGQQINIPMPSLNMVPVGLSPDGSQFLVLDGTGYPVSGPFWSLPIMGGSPRGWERRWERSQPGPRTAR